MGDNIFGTRALIVTRFVGPAHESPDRYRWQLTPLRDSLAVLTREEIRHLAHTLLADTAEHPWPNDA